ncbi:MAG: tetratricopeptide repeat protein [Spirochaetia bacterium]|nr:tetratricopeptide repeat protein [Spirochaetia bacterium]
MAFDKRKLVPIAVAAGLVLLLSIGGVSLLSGGQRRERANTLALARQYLEDGDYGRSLDLLDRLLIKDSDDDEARELRELVVAARKAAEDGDSDALARILARLGDSLSRPPTVVVAPRTAETPSPDGGASGGAAADSGGQAPAPAAAVPAVASDAAAAKAEEEARRKAEADAAAARAKAEADALAKLGAERTAFAEAARKALAEGKEKLESGDDSGAAEDFSDAKDAAAKVGDKRFSSNLLTDTAEAWLDRYEDVKGTPAAADISKNVQKAAMDAIAADGTNARPHGTLGDIYSDTKLYDQAASSYKEAARLDPSNWSYVYELGKAYYGARKFDDARSAFEAVTGKLNRTYEPAHYNLGLTYLQLKATDKALMSFREAARLKPDYVGAWVQIGRALSARSDTKGAIDALLRALSFEPENVTALRELGAAYAKAGQNAEAERSFESALALSDDALTNFNAANVENALGKHAEARDHAARAVALAPSVASYHYVLGFAKDLAGDDDGAILAYQKAASLDAKYVLPRINLGAIYLEGGLVDKAMTVLLEAYNIDQKSLEANNNLGNVYGKKEIWDRSVFHYELAKALAPKDATVRLNLARAYVSWAKLGEARKEYEDLVKLAPAEPWEARHELGTVLIQLGEKAAAKAVLEELLAKNPGYAKAAEVRTALSGL